MLLYQYTDIYLRTDINYIDIFDIYLKDNHVEYLQGLKISPIVLSLLMAFDDQLE